MARPDEAISRARTQPLRDLAPVAAVAAAAALAVAVVVGPATDAFDAKLGRPAGVAQLFEAASGVVDSEITVRIRPEAPPTRSIGTPDRPTAAELVGAGSVRASASSPARSARAASPPRSGTLVMAAAPLVASADAAPVAPPAAPAETGPAPAVVPAPAPELGAAGTTAKRRPTLRRADRTERASVVALASRGAAMIASVLSLDGGGRGGAAEQPVDGDRKRGAKGPNDGPRGHRGPDPDKHGERPHDPAAAKRT